MNQLFGDYFYKELTSEELAPLWHEYHPLVFKDIVNFDLPSSLSDQERLDMERLREPFRDLYTLRLGIYHGDQFVGWNVSVQDTWARFYMMNTGLVPEHQGKGIYTNLLPVILDVAREKGFQVVHSRHHATNSAVIVPKLKAGFIISGMELTDRFGLLVNLSYFFNERRRKVMAFRAGEFVPDADIRPYLNLSKPFD